MNITTQYSKVRKGEELDENLIKEILFESSLIPNKKRDIFIHQFSSGYSNLTYLIQCEEKEFVLRRPPFGAIKRGHDMGREYKVLSALHPHFPKVPNVYLFDESKYFGVPFYIMEKVDGIILNMREAKSRKLSASSYKTISESWLSTMIELHTLDYKKMGLENFGKPEGYVERQVNIWSKQYIKAKTKEVPAAEEVMKWMHTNKVNSDHYSLIHNDFRYDNMIFEDDSWTSVKAILDWEMATVGDPLMDLGTSLAYWTMDSDADFLKKGLPSPTIFEGNPGRLELVEMYANLSGKKIDNILFYYVYGLFKIAVIAQQIYFRYHKGLTQDPKFAGLESASEGLCIMALQAIKKNRIESLF